MPTTNMTQNLEYPFEGLAISPSRWPDDISGYVQYTDTRAAQVDISKALSGLEDLERALFRGWFSHAYLAVLSGTQTADCDENFASDEALHAEIKECLIWLRHVHDNTNDNAIVDTNNVASAFLAQMNATAKGVQFRLNIPRGETGPVFPELAAKPLSVTPEQIKSTSKTIRHKVSNEAQALARIHKSTLAMD